MSFRTFSRALTPTLLAGLALAGCGSSSSPHSSQAKASTPANPAQTAQTAFTTHAGLAFGTFERYIYTPFSTGEFRTAAGAAALGRARLAAAYVAAQLDQATRAAEASSALTKLLPPLRTLDEGFHAALVKLRDGHFNMSEIQAAYIAIGAIKGSAQDAGTPISESTPSSI